MKHTLRQTAASLGDSVLPYTSYSINDSEYIGTFNGTVDECISYLKDNGYHYQLFAAVKDVDGIEDSGSYAKIPDSHPKEVAGTALSSLNPEECQYHIHIFEINGVVKLYGHYEIHPYPHTPSWDITRSYPRHYYPTWDSDNNPREEWTYLRGVSDLDI